MIYGSVEVPWTAGWTGESEFSIAPCRWAEGRMAICQSEAPGRGKPQFAKPHMIRQRQAMVELRCDLCGRQLAAATKVSLSSPRLTIVSGHGAIPLQVEPLLHRSCAQRAIQLCPELRRRRAAGDLLIRQVFACKPVLSLLNEAAAELYTGRRYRGAVGHMKLAVTRSVERDECWLGSR